MNRGGVGVGAYYRTRPNADPFHPEGRAGLSLYIYRLYLQVETGSKTNPMLGILHTENGTSETVCFSLAWICRETTVTPIGGVIGLIGRKNFEKI